MKANKDNLTYNNVPIYFDCSCAVPKPTKETNPLCCSTKCVCDGWIKDTDLMVEYTEYTEVNETSL